MLQKSVLREGKYKTHLKHSSGPAGLSAGDAEPLPSLLFSLLQVLLILTALQPSIFSVLANGGQIACSPPFSSKIRSQGEHVGAPILFQDGQEGEVREERNLERKLGQPISEYSECSAQNTEKGTCKKSSRSSKQTMTSLITQRRAAIPQLEASPDGQPRKPWVQPSAPGRAMGVVRKQKSC